MNLQRLCALTELPPRGGQLFLDAAGSHRDVLVFKLEDASLVVYDAHCPHAGALLRPENCVGKTLICFLHNWEFDIASGDCHTYPTLPLRKVAFEIKNDDLYVDLHDIPVRGRPSSAPKLSLGSTGLKITSPKDN